jgi:hypothetical protein
VKKLLLSTPTRTEYWCAVAITLLTLVGTLTFGQDAAKKAAPKLCHIDPRKLTVIMGSDAALTGGLNELYPGPEWKRFWVENWRQTRDRFDWTLENPEAGDYAITLLLKDDSGATDASQIEIAAGNSKLTHVVNREKFWNRHILDGTIHLPAGRSTLTLRATKLPSDAKLALLSVELVRPAVWTSMQEKAKSLRSSTQWLVDAKYGVMTHWTARSMPRTGPRKPYAEAVKNLNVESFAAMVQKTGAGFLVFTTSWADFYFPAPIKAIDEILPGRTTPRDLVRELAKALAKQNIKLILYFHPGHDDQLWWSKLKYDGEQDKSRYFDLWCKVISSIGERYGTLLAGWWFDDGMGSYYPYNAPWEKMTRAAKTSNPARVVGYNAWIWPKATDYQDFSCGETDFSEFLGKEFLPKGGSGVFTGGPQSGLQAALTWMLEPGNWCHLNTNKEILPPLYSRERFTRLMRGCASRRIVPMLNLEVYQDGSARPASLELLREVGEPIKKLEGSLEQIQDDIANNLLPQTGDIALESAHGKLRGKLVYIENVDCICYWRDSSASVEWSFTAPNSGKYRIFVTCTHGNGPSEYEVAFGEQRFQGKIAGIGADPGWSDYQDEALGTIELAKGRQYDVTIRVTSMPKGAAMNLRRILLRPLQD